jgi:hypothetical protein
MEKRSHSQLELFSETKIGHETKTHLPNSLLTYIWGYEKAILIIICFIITGIVSFSLGVEKGKNVVASKVNSYLDLAVKIDERSSGQVATTQQSRKPIIEKQLPVPLEKQGVINPAEIKESIRNYTIQVASYQTKSHAEKEATTLKKKGFSPLVLSKGRYAVLCVGNFSNRERAKSLMPELKKLYSDCFVRRL